MYVKLRNLLLCATVIGVTACSGPAQYIDTSVVGPKLRAPDPAPIHLTDVEFMVISQENVDDYLEDIRDGDLTVIGMTPEGYKNLSINTKKLQNYIKSQRELIRAYREFYENE